MKRKKKCFICVIWPQMQRNIIVLFGETERRRESWADNKILSFSLFIWGEKWSTLYRKTNTWTLAARQKHWCFSAPDCELSYSQVDCSLQSRRHSAENRPWASILEPLIQIKTSTSPLFHHSIMLQRNIIFQLNVIIWGVAWTVLS